MVLHRNCCCRRYVNFIKRIDELERKIKFFGEEIHKFGLHAAYQVSAWVYEYRLHLMYSLSATGHSIVFGPSEHVHVLKQQQQRVLRHSAQLRKRLWHTVGTY